MTVGRVDFLRKLMNSNNREFLNQLIDNGFLNGPRIVELDITTTCNYQCSFCIDDKVINNKTSFKLEKIIELIDEMALIGVKGVVLIGGGEPLLYPYFHEVVERLYNQNIVIGLTTNGSPMDSYIDTIKKYVTWVRISMDAGTSQTHKILKKPPKEDDFSNILSSVKVLSDGYKGAIGYSFIVNDDNYTEIEEATRIAKETGFSYIQFKPLVDQSLKSLSLLKPKIIDIVLKSIEKSKQLETEDFRVIINDNLKIVLSNKKELNVKSYDYCWTQEFRTLITPSGLYICPYHRGNENKRFGNLENNTLEEIWDSEERKSLLEVHNPMKHCNFYCIRNDINEFLFSIMNLKEKGIHVLNHMKEYNAEDVKNCIFI
ncbi:radical SAM protein [Alkaliphilus hydrothermalis]|uniref:MoaA/NifB/PqqE/SkfB family radical SAM enzyme n=1 Tax=Alkaliphilus hydrothermalis TaxID=1482730 RepID=A0ABS2NTM2_9FIRM|nr:radical SAM/SPASM domain-containing protein [Alkaliphilus hydrothermalis]MBM7616212.1 MoaA/NifB/PqqE/SkfB family radical SAM enzyme [Alkaliphilus hydrothermalis]